MSHIEDIMNIQGVATQMFVWGQVYGKAGKSEDGFTSVKGLRGERVTF